MHVANLVVVVWLVGYIPQVCYFLDVGSFGFISRMKDWKLSTATCPRHQSHLRDRMHMVQFNISTSRCLHLCCINADPPVSPHTPWSTKLCQLYSYTCDTLRLQICGSNKVFLLHDLQQLNHLISSNKCTSHGNVFSVLFICRKLYKCIDI